MSELVTRLQADLNASRKAQDKPATLLLGTVISDIKNRRIELQKDLADSDVVEVLRKGIKRRRESVEMYEKGGREDLAAKERVEVTLLAKYLPPQAGEEELRSAVKAAIASGAVSIGAVMGSVVPRFKGRAEGSAINAIAREELAKQG